MSVQEPVNKPYVSPGMPPLVLGRTTSFFEFWPTWLIYIPVVLQWLWLAIRHRSWTLPLIANPQLPLSGMVGVPKSLLLAQARHELKQSILPWFIHVKSHEAASLQAVGIEQRLTEIDTDYPFVCKPDIGCRGVGVKLVRNRQQLISCLQNYPSGAQLMLQRLSDFEPEAGIFYVRQPGSAEGKIISMAFKYMPYVIGDGERTLGELIHTDVRAGELSHLYEKRHQKHWHSVIPEGQPFRLVFSASHSKGAIFKDAQNDITPELTQKLNHLMHQLPEFHYGRLDVKFKNVDSLRKGEHLQIVEINTASSESLHIWDSNTGFSDAIAALMFQYRTLFQMGALNRKQGYQPPGLIKLVKHWHLERKLTHQYPETD